MSQLYINRIGPPLEVVELRPQERPVPGPGEVLVRMQAAAINPADFNYIEGTYGSKANLPCPPGMEGMGVIEELGEGVTGLLPGSPVLPLQSPGAWAMWRILRPDQLHVLPQGIDPYQAARPPLSPVPVPPMTPPAKSKFLSGLDMG